MALPVFDPTRADSYEITYGGELNQPISYTTNASLGNDTVTIQYDPQGKVTAAYGSPFSQDGKQYVRDYDAQGNVVNVREYNKPSFWSDIGQPALFLGTAALGANLLGPLVNGLGTSAATGSGAWLGEGVASGVPAWDAAYGGALLEGGAGLGTAGAVGAGAGGAGTSTLGTAATKLLSNPSIVSGLLGSFVGSQVAGGGSPSVGSIPTQGIPMNTPEYYQQMQGFLNQYLPGKMPNQADYLASWYGTAPTGGGMMSGGVLPTPTVPQPQRPMATQITPQTINQAIRTTLMNDPNVNYNQLKDVAIRQYQVDPFEFDRQWADVTGERFSEKYSGSQDPIIQALVRLGEQQALRYQLAASPEDYSYATSQATLYAGADEPTQLEMVQAALAEELAARPDSSLADLQAVAQNAYGVDPADVAAAYYNLRG